MDKFSFGAKKKPEEPLKTEKPAELPENETKEVPAPGPFFEAPNKPEVGDGRTEYEKMLDEMKARWKERTADFAQQEDHLLIMKRAGRILNTLTWRHGVHMMAQKMSRVLQEYENPGKVSADRFADALIDLANFCLLTAEAHGRG